MKLSKEWLIITARKMRAKMKKLGIIKLLV